MTHDELNVLLERECPNRFYQPRATASTPHRCRLCNWVFSLLADCFSLSKETEYLNVSDIREIKRMHHGERGYGA